MGYVANWGCTFVGIHAIITYSSSAVLAMFWAAI